MKKEENHERRLSGPDIIRSKSDIRVYQS